jgi:Flp pilus assembly protein TadD
MSPLVRANPLKHTASLVVIALALGLGGCATSKMTTGSIGRSHGKPVEQMTGPELSAASDSYGQAYERNPKDKAAGLAYANVLRMAGRTDQALAVMRQTAIYLPNDREVLAAYGKALAGAGQFDGALDAIRRAQRPEFPDWKLLSAEGAILDQQGHPQEARALYNKALDIQPNEASIQSNLGMSYLLEGDLKTAESYFSSAARSPGADSTVRQNLALVIGLQGRFDEAEQVARRELSPEQADANVAYLRRMLAQQDSLSQLKKSDAG